MNEEMEQEVQKYRDKGIVVEQELIDYLIWYCHRKMEVAKVENRDEYLPLLFKDELKNYFTRLAINATTMLRMMGEEVLTVV